MRGGFLSNRSLVAVPQERFFKVHRVIACAIRDPLSLTREFMVYAATNALRHYRLLEYFVLYSEYPPSLKELRRMLLFVTKSKI